MEEAGVGAAGAVAVVRAHGWFCLNIVGRKEDRSGIVYAGRAGAWCFSVPIGERKEKRGLGAREGEMQKRGEGGWREEG